jgi:chitodextrinase
LRDQGLGASQNSYSIGLQFSLTPDRAGHKHGRCRRGGVTADTSPPSAPTGPKVTPADTAAALTWTASSDNVGVTGYRIFHNGVQVGTSSTTTFTDTGLTPGTSYTYTVIATDAAKNESEPSSPVTVATTSAPSLSLYTTVRTRQSSPASTIVSPALTTSKPGELLLASDGPGSASSQSISSVTCAGLTWSCGAGPTARPARPRSGRPSHRP